MSLCLDKNNDSENNLNLEGDHAREANSLQKSSIDETKSKPVVSEISKAKTCSEEEIVHNKVVTTEVCKENVEHHQVKQNSINIRVSHETSPLKQAVKGYVLNKLSKKVNSSNLLSGIRERIVKKLEEGEENELSDIISKSESEVLLSVHCMKESTEKFEYSANLTTSELKSAVSSNLTEISHIEEALECLEEPKSASSDSKIETNTSYHFFKGSKSLPASPAHQRLTISSGSNDEAETHSLIDNFESETSELNINSKVNGSESSRTSNVNYPPNSYIGSSERTLKESFILIIHNSFLFWKTICTSSSLPHLFLLISVLIHNSSLLCCYLTLMYDGLVIAYIIYFYITVLIQNTSESNTYIGCTDSKVEKLIVPCPEHHSFESCVKILKEDYDPESVGNYLTDFVDLSIENRCLKVSKPKKRVSSTSVWSDCSLCYNLQGSRISIVPKNLSRRRLWNKKYPICILLREINGSEIENCEDHETLSPQDYISHAPVSDKNQVSEARAIYLFTLTDREKESLFWALHDAATEKDPCLARTSSEPALKADALSISYSSLLEMEPEDNSMNENISDEVDDTKRKLDLDFSIYMAMLFKKGEKYLQDLTILEPVGNTEWLNIMLGRLFYDFMTQNYWSRDVMRRIQKKLDKIIMPNFMEALRVSDIYMGTSIPQISKISHPVMDSNGLWLDLDFDYSGSFQMTLQTKMRLQRDRDPSVDRQSNDSGESSGEEASDSSKAQYQGKSKLFDRIEKWVSYRHFQTVAQNKFVKKYVGDLSNLPLTLTVEVNELHGILALNLPPIPTDRIWYGFRRDPVLAISAYPKVGTREINLSPIVQLIQNNLIREFKKVLVMPNMDDVWIPLMYSPVYDQMMT